MNSIEQFTASIAKTHLNPDRMTHLTRRLFSLFIIPGVFILAISCKDHGGNRQTHEKPLPPPPVKTVAKVDEVLRQLWEYAGQNNGKINDSTQLIYTGVLAKYYGDRNFQPAWSHEGKWNPAADSLFEMISRSKEYGLFPSDYHLLSLLHIRNQFVTDTEALKNTVLWAGADLLLSDAYLAMGQHLNTGRLPHDSITLRKDSFPADFYLQHMQAALDADNVVQSLQALEPHNAGYQDLKAGIKHFLDSVSLKQFTYIRYPNRDSLALLKQVAQRLLEAGFLTEQVPDGDTVVLKEAISKYQKTRNMKVTGKPSETMIRGLNNTDWEKFKRIAITLDRYKQLPDTMPATYVWVNLPAYMLSLHNDDSIAFYSRVICGNPKTRTPVLSSDISNFITYPQWTVPYSIIFKEMLPKIQENVNYLDKQNLMVVDKNDSVINPHLVNWAKLNRNNFPYQLKQRQGDDNSLGVIKFNFRNKYSVYLHDTNARWLFSKPVRALSHGCVRVQEWEKLSRFLVRNDSINYPVDTLKAWIIRQEKHQVSGFPKVPVFIRYFTCEGKGGRVKFYDDIYGEDRILSEHYFATKRIQ